MPAESNSSRSSRAICHVYDQTTTGSHHQATVLVPHAESHTKTWYPRGKTEHGLNKAGGIPKPLTSPDSSQIQEPNTTTGCRTRTFGRMPPQHSTSPPAYLHNAECANSLQHTCAGTCTMLSALTVLHSICMLAPRYGELSFSPNRQYSSTIHYSVAMRETHEQVPWGP